MSVNLLRYAGTYTATILGIMVLAYVLDAFVGVPFPKGVGTVLPTLVASMLEGQFYARKHGAVLSKGDAWRAAFAMTAVVAVLNIALMAALMLMPGVAEMLGSLSIALWVGILVFLLGIVLLVNRFFLGFGARNELKAAARRVK
ncbi:MAG: ABZJ_00895 family protein [Roseovarius sp.]|nr:ABZJ_00895 family protein [Roseovarius sp.]